MAIVKVRRCLENHPLMHTGCNELRCCNVESTMANEYYSKLTQARLIACSRSIVDTRSQTTKVCIR